MSTIKWKFNIWTVITFLWCLALAVVITQPILARADNEWANALTIDTTFSNAKRMSLNELNVSNSVNIWNSEIENWQFCNQSWACIKLDWDMISVNKIKFWNWELGSSDVVLISWNMLYAYNEAYGEQTVWLNTFIGMINDSDKDWILKFLYERWFSRWISVDPEYNPDGNNQRPIRELYWLQFNQDDTLWCSEDTQWTVRYVPNENWSQLVMCMKISSTSYSGVVLKEFSNGTEL